MSLTAKSLALSIAVFLGFAMPIWGQPLQENKMHSSPLLEAKVSLWKGDRQLEQGDVEGAIKSYLEASTYMRDAPEPHFALAQVYARRSIMDAFLEFAIGVKLLFSNFFYQAVLLSNTVAVGVIAVSVAIYIAIVFILLRYARLIWASLQISLPEWLLGKNGKAVMYALVAGLILVTSSRGPVVMLTWICVIGAAGVWRFAGSGERRIIVVFAVYLLLIGGVLTLTGRILSTQLPHSTVRLASLADKVDKTWLVRAYATNRSQKKFDPVGQFITGLLSLKSKQYRQAIDHFNLVTKFSPSNAAVFNNIGVAYYELGNLKQAKRMFETALKYGQRAAIVHYNYSQVLNALLEYDLAEEELAKASALDFGTIRTLLTAQEPGPVPMNLQTRVLWQLALSPDNDYLRMTYHPVESGPLGSIILVVVALAFGYGAYRLRIPATCDICDEPIPLPVTRRRGKQLLCKACATIASAHHEHRELEFRYNQRILELERRSRWLTIIFGLLLPGTLYHMTGKRFKGLLITACFSSLLLLLVANGPLIKPLPNLRAASFNGWLLPLSAICYAFYVWRMFRVTLKKAREEHSNA